MNIQFKNAKTVWILLAILAACIAYMIWSTMKHFQHNRTIKEQNIELANLREIAQTNPTSLIKTKEEVIMLPGDSIPYPIYHTKYLDKPGLSKSDMKKIAVADLTVRNVLKTLDIKAKEVERFTTLYTTTRAENLQLKQDLAKNFVYKDKYIYIEQDTNRVVKTIDVKGNISITDYYKKPNLIAPKTYYTSLITTSPYLKLDSINKIGREQRSTVFSMYVDNRVALPVTKGLNTNISMGEPIFTSTLNFELNNHKLFSGYIGAGIMAQYEYVGFTAIGGVKVNLWRIKK